jgi:putative hydrolase of the HAD superfamily
LRNSLQAILFDADGVIQRPAVDYASAFAKLVALQREDLDSLLAEIFAAERPTLIDGGDFAAHLEPTLSRWNLAHRLEDVLRIWTDIETDTAMLASVASLRSLGLVCCLATNQQAFRGRQMSETLGYRDVFDSQFYSYQLGVAKPAPEYFRFIIERLDLAPSDILFIDDHEPNVAAARGVGLNAAVFTATTKTSTAALRTILSRHHVQLP